MSLAPGLTTCPSTRWSTDRDSAESVEGGEDEFAGSCAPAEIPIAARRK
jgi:hypothetical protein